MLYYQANSRDLFWFDINEVHSTGKVFVKQISVKKIFKEFKIKPFNVKNLILTHLKLGEGIVEDNYSMQISESHLVNISVRSNSASTYSSLNESEGINNEVRITDKFSESSEKKGGFNSQFFINLAIIIAVSVLIYYYKKNKSNNQRKVKRFKEDKLD